MAWLISKFRIPASESLIGLVLAVCIVMMASLSVAVVWQAEIIASQRASIRWLARPRLHR
jgi:hypothetical protein